MKMVYTGKAVKSNRESQELITADNIQDINKINVSFHDALDTLENEIVSALCLGFGQILSH